MENLKTPQSTQIIGWIAPCRVFTFVPRLWSGITSGCKIKQTSLIELLDKGGQFDSKQWTQHKGPLDKKWGNIPPVLKGRFANSTYLTGKQNFFFSFP